jgi:alkylhydroperoxidase family enzyme
LTRLSEGHTHGAALDALKAEFSEAEQVQLTLLINIITGWNRVAVAFDLWLETPATKARDATQLQAAA